MLGDFRAPETIVTIVRRAEVVPTACSPGLSGWVSATIADLLLN